MYGMVERNKIWDTMILKRLLSLATVGHTARGEMALDHCTQVHLGVQVDKHVKDHAGKDVDAGA